MTLNENKFILQFMSLSPFDWDIEILSRENNFWVLSVNVKKKNNHFISDGVELIIPSFRYQIGTSIGGRSFFALLLTK